MKYFACGSNLCSRRLCQRTPSASIVTVARLDSHVLKFHKVGFRDRSGKCNAYATGQSSDTVWGAVFEIDPAEKARLDDAEGVGFGYMETKVRVESTGGMISAFTYVAVADAIRPDLRPYLWYKALVLAGATEHALSPDYIEAIRAVVAIQDPDEGRRASNEQILSGARSMTPQGPHP